MLVFGRMGFALLAGYCAPAGALNCQQNPVRTEPDEYRIPASGAIWRFMWHGKVNCITNYRANQIQRGQVGGIIRASLLQMPEAAQSHVSQGRDAKRCHGPIKFAIVEIKQCNSIS